MYPHSNHTKAFILAAKQTSTSKVALAALLHILLLLLLSSKFGWPLPLLFNATISMPRGVWLLQEHDAPHRYRAGDVVSVRGFYRSRQFGCPKEGQTLLKYISAVPGDRVCLDDTSLRVEGNDGLTWRKRELDAEQTRHQVTWGCRELGAHEYIITTPEPLSCDSRYFGSVRDNLIRGTATPLFVF